MGGDKIPDVDARDLDRFFWGIEPKGTLRDGDSGPACRNLRSALSLLLKDDLGGGSDYDTALHNAVAQFQTLNDHRFKDGVCSEGTRGLLIRRLQGLHPYFFDRAIDPERRAEGHCLISYSRKDEELVVGYQAAIEALGYSAWRDKEAMPAGQVWRDHLREQIAASYLVLAFATDSFLASEICRQEIEFAAQRGRPIAILAFAEIKSDHWLSANFDTFHAIKSRRWISVCSRARPRTAS